MQVIESFRVVGWLFDEEHEIGFLKAFRPDGADPLFPDAEVGDRNAGHDPCAVRKLERRFREIDVNVVEGLKGELALVLKLIGCGMVLCHRVL